VTAANEFSAEEVDALLRSEVGQIGDHDAFSLLTLAELLELDPATENRHEDSPLLWSSGGLPARRALLSPVV
jgi:hypothetical protein